MLVDSDPNHLAKEHVHKFVHFDFSNHKIDSVHAKNIINMLLKQSIHVQGCLTFWEDCVPLTAMISETLGTNGTNSSVARERKI